MSLLTTNVSLIYQCPGASHLHLHNPVQASCSFLHLHGGLHDRLQVHLTLRLKTSLAKPTVVHTGKSLLFSSLHPYKRGSGSGAKAMWLVAQMDA